MPPLDGPLRAEFPAQDLVGKLFSAHGWKVQRRPDVGPHEPDFLVRKGRHAFVAEVKASAEGRADRVIPLLSHAILQARAYALALKVRPLAVVYVRDASPSLISQVGLFSKEYAADVAVGIVSEHGVRYFVGGGLEGLNVDPGMVRAARSPGRAPNLFSDLNQWMLKVLLAPEIPEHLLAAPRGQHRNASELAGAAGVSVMSAFRFVDQLRREGYLDESPHHLKLVRRADLFRRWQAESLRGMPREMPMRFLLRGQAESRIPALLVNRHACLALFAAADALRLGHVKGVVPYIYVPKLARVGLEDWQELAPLDKGERPDLILREAPAPQSVFRGRVAVHNVPVCDVLQVWLDVSAHPSRGQEQAELIRRKALSRVIDRVLE